VIVENEQIKRIPLLHVVNQDERQEKLPLVIFIHGFMSVKERNLHYAYLLAEAGFRVVMPEVLYHGERDQGLKAKEFYLHFWEMVLNTINEINGLKEFYEEKGLIDSEHIGLAGTSMGGIVTLGALTQYKWIKAAVSLMGMPSYENFSLWQLEQLKSQGMSLPFTNEQIEEQLKFLREYDLSVQPEKLANRPLLFWHGKKDHLVPYPLAHQFFEGVKSNYQDIPEKLNFITDEKAGHNVSLEGVKATVQWFINHLL
jgi:fermentation-respiration switch protein FrsA (DUF1100 family)